MRSEAVPPRSTKSSRSTRRATAFRRASGSARMGGLPRTIPEPAQRLRSRDVSALELADAFLAAAKADPFNAWLHLAPEHAREQAKAADARLGAGDAPLLTGVPW